MTPSSARIALSDVSATMLLTLYCHVRDQQARHPILPDPESLRLWEALRPKLSEAQDPRLARLLSSRIPDLGVTYVAMRARYFDQVVRDFLTRFPVGRVVNMGCGLDPRFSRVDNGIMQFVDVDLPPVIALKSAFFAESDRYRLIAAAVTDPGWLDVLGESPAPTLFLAEGLFMYLTEDQVRSLVLGLQRRFPGSELLFEGINRRWLDPKVYWLLRCKLRRGFGLGPDATFRFGLANSHEVEAWGPGIRWLDEWSFMDASWSAIGWVKAFAGVQVFRKAMWLVRYRLE